MVGQHTRHISNCLFGVQSFETLRYIQSKQGALTCASTSPGRKARCTPGSRARHTHTMVGHPRYCTACKLHGAENYEQADYQGDLNNIAFDTKQVVTLVRKDATYKHHHSWTLEPLPLPHDCCLKPSDSAVYLGWCCLPALGWNHSLM